MTTDIRDMKATALNTIRDTVREVAKDMARAMAAMCDLIIPRYCIVCGRRLLLYEKYICIYCVADFPFTYNWRITHNRMADRFNTMIQRDIEGRMAAPACDTSQPGREAYAYAAALFLYRGDAPYRRIPYRLKYHGDTAAGRYFGKILGKRLASARHFNDADMVIPVPLHWQRKWARGYNQAEIIAKEVAAATGASLRTDILIRTRKTKTQTRLDVDSKARNVKGAFAVREKFVNSIPPAHHILIVDDVFTTGATINACFNALRTVYGPGVRISAVTLAFVDNG